MEVITLEIINKEAMALLQNLEKLNLIRLIEQKKEEKNISLAGSLSKKSADLLREHTKEVREEWEK